MKRLILCLAFIAVKASASELPYFQQFTKQIVRAPKGNGQQIHSDWQSIAVQKQVKKRSYQNIFVRMFPLLSTPYRDPYPRTQNLSRVFFYNSKGIEVYDEDQRELLAVGISIQFYFYESKFSVDGREFPLEKLWLKAKDSATTTTLRWDRGLESEVGLELRGAFLIKPTSFERSSRIRKPTFMEFSLDPMKVNYFSYAKSFRENLWSVINVLSMNEYLYAVVPSEMPSNWHPEALKVQAVAARTYAIFEAMEAREYFKREWDVDPTTWFQSYKGKKFRLRNGNWSEQERNSTSTAVDATFDQAMFYRGEIIKAYFSSNSGGKTCSAVECFHISGPNPEYLIPVDDAPGIRDVGVTGTWGKRAKVNRTNILSRLVKLGFSKHLKVNQLSALRKGESGRTWQLAVELMGGKKILLTRKQSAKMLGMFGSVRSYLFKLFPVDETGNQKVIGHGYGHGVGMSQWGARLFAEMGWSHDQILSHYYSGAELRELSH